LEGGENIKGKFLPACKDKGKGVPAPKAHMRGALTLELYRCE